MQERTGDSQVRTLLGLAVHVRDLLQDSARHSPAPMTFRDAFEGQVAFASPAFKPAAKAKRQQINPVVNAPAKELHPRYGANVVRLIRAGGWAVETMRQQGDGVLEPAVGAIFSVEEKEPPVFLVLKNTFLHAQTAPVRRVRRSRSV